MKILAHSHITHAVTDELPSLKEQVKAATGTHVRRIGRFIQLALIGAGECLRDRRLPKDAAVYLSSGRGDLEVTLEVLVDMVEHGQAPKPLSFINTVSNSSCFYVARQFGLHGISQFVTRRHAPLESALQLAMLDIRSGNTGMALVGTVDIVTQPLADHRERLQLPANSVVGEGSHWFLLAADTDAGDALARIDTVLTLPDRNAVEIWLREYDHSSAPAVFAAGQHLDADTAMALQASSGIRATLGYRQPLPWYDSQAGAALAAFLSQKPATRLLYLDSDPAGRFSIIQCHR